MQVYGLLWRHFAFARLEKIRDVFACPSLLFYSPSLPLLTPQFCLRSSRVGEEETAPVRRWGVHDQP